MNEKIRRYLREKEKLTQELGRYPYPEEVAVVMDVKTEYVTDTIKAIDKIIGERMDKLSEAQELSEEEFVKKHKDSFVITKQPDGNYKGWAWKYERVIKARDYGPDIVLQRLLVHDGREE